MSRSRQYMEKKYLPLTPILNAVVSYYADRVGKDETDIMRSMLMHYAKYDVDLDLAAFEKYVKAQILPDLRDDEELLKETKTQVQRFVSEVHCNSKKR